jgi:hypothetical protein
MGIHFHGVIQLLSDRRDQDPTKDRPVTPTSLFKWRGALKCPKSDLSPNSAVCECRWSRTWLKGPPAMQTLPALRTHAA